MISENDHFHMRMEVNRPLRQICLFEKFGIPNEKKTSQSPRARDRKSHRPSKGSQHAYARRAVRICKKAGEPASSSKICKASFNPLISASRRLLRSAYGSGFAMHIGCNFSQYSMIAAYSVDALSLSSFRPTKRSSVSFLSLPLYLTGPTKRSSVSSLSSFRPTKRSSVSFLSL